MKNAVFWGVTPCGSCKKRRWLLQEPYGVTSQKTAFFSERAAYNRPRLLYSEPLPSYQTWWERGLILHRRTSTCIVKRVTIEA
jgi:hypothetical protein